MIIPQESKKFMPDMTIYVTEEQREQMDRLLGELATSDEDVRDNRGNLSYSRLIRFALAALDREVAAAKAWNELPENRVGQGDNTPPTAPTAHETAE